jgi:hypothetical protein
MHTRYPRAAAAAAGEANPSSTPADAFPVAPRPSVPFAKRARTLWASQSLPVRGGRLIGVRLRGAVVEVAFVKQGADGLRWVSAEAVLSEYQAQVWLATANFRP